MKRQNFIRMIAKSNSEEYGVKMTDFEVDSLLMSLENHGYNVEEIFGIKDTEEEGAIAPYIDLFWNEESYLQGDGENYHPPNGFTGKEGPDAMRVELDEDGKVKSSERVSYENLPENVKSQFPRGQGEQK